MGHRYIRNKNKKMPKTRVIRKKRGGANKLIEGLKYALPFPLNMIASKMAGGAKKRTTKRSRKVRGRGFLGNLLTDIGGGLGQGTHDLFGKLFGGAKKRARRPRRKIGGLDFGPDSVLGKLKKVAQDSQVLSKGLNEFGYNNLAAGANALGFGRKRVARRKRGGMSMSIMPSVYRGMSGLTL